MKRLYLAAFVLLALSMSTSQIVNSSSVANVQATSTSLNRTVYLEPSYQVYVDQVSIPDSSPNFNITFDVFSSNSLFSVNAYGPSNQSLNIITFTNTTAGTFTFQVNTSGISSFTLITVLDEMTFVTGNFTAFVDFYPSDGDYSASTTIYLPSGAQLLSYTDQTFANSTSNGIWLLNGQKVLAPTSNSTVGSVSYEGNFSLIMADSLSRSIDITPSAIFVQDDLLLKNIGNTLVTSASFTLPSEATGITVRDSIGYFTFSTNNHTINFDLRARLYPNERADFTIQYTLPLSDMLKNENGVNILTSSVLPSWVNMPVTNASVSIQMPAGSSNAQLQGGQIVPGYRLTANSQYTLLTPYTNQNFTLIYTTSSTIAPYYGIIILAAIIIAAIVSASAYRLRLKRKTTPQKPAPPAVADKKKP